MKSAPEHFLSLQAAGFVCRPYYFGEGGTRIKLTPELLAEAGHPDSTLWVHPEVIVRLENCRMVLAERDFGIQISDAFRSLALYELIRKHHAEHQPSAVELISKTRCPHSTGMAIDVDLVDPQTGKNIWLRNHGRDGNPSTVYGFYGGHADREGLEYHYLQRLLVQTFLDEGFGLGEKKEYWHFEAPGVDSVSRF